MQSALRVFLICVLYYTKSFSQIGLANQFLSGSIEDGEKYTREYLKPISYLLVFSGGNDISWNTNSEDNIGIELNCNSILIPNKYKDFSFSSVGFENFVTSNTDYAAKLQTIAGNDAQIFLETKSKYRFVTNTSPYYSQKPIAKFKSPQGVDFPFLSQPFLKIGYQWKNFSFIFKGFPRVTYRELDASLISYGSFVQKKVAWDAKNTLYFCTGLQKTQLSYNPNIYPDSALVTISSSVFSVSYDNQQLIMKSTAIPFELGYTRNLNSKWQCGINAAYVIGNSLVALKGNYPLYFSDSSNLYNVIIANVANPFSYTQKYHHLRSNVKIGYAAKYFYSNMMYSYSDFQSYHLSFGLKI